MSSLITICINIAVHILQCHSLPFQYPFCSLRCQLRGILVHVKSYPLSFRIFCNFHGVFYSDIHFVFFFKIRDTARWFWWISKKCKFVEYFLLSFNFPRIFSITARISREMHKNLRAPENIIPYFTLMLLRFMRNPETGSSSNFRWWLN